MLRDRLLLALVGYTGAGKTSSAEYLRDMHDFRLIEGSSLIGDEAAMRNAPPLQTRDDYEAFFQRMQRERSPTWLSDTVLACNEVQLVWSGLRSMHDYRAVKAAGGFVVALTCPPETVLAHLDASELKNAQTLEEYNYHLALEQNAGYYGSNTAMVIERADFTVDNSGTRAATNRQLDGIVAQTAHQLR